MVGIRKLPQVASINTILVRLGHESLDVTLAYLKGKDAEKERINTGDFGRERDLPFSLGRWFPSCPSSTRELGEALVDFQLARSRREWAGG
jgi:hypothetical protein